EQRRPFGIFPEPSAMAASTTPWITLLLATLLHYPRSSHHTTYNTPLVLMGVASGLSLIALSKTGGLAIAIIAAAAVAAPSALRLLKRLSFRTTGVLIAALIATVLTLAWTFDNMEKRLELGTNTSWQLRTASL